MNKQAAIMNDNGAIVIHNGQYETVTEDHENWSEIRDCITTGRYYEATRLINQFGIIEELVNADPDIEIKGTSMFYDGYMIDNSLTRRIIDMAREGVDCGPLKRFLGRLMKNPSCRSISEAYGFLSKNNLPITEDGKLVAFKAIKQDWTDKYTGDIDNSIGQVVNMPRGLVDDNSDKTCSSGLHACSLEYLNKCYYSSDDRLVAVLIDPADIVSIPKDYDFSKMRVCEYTVWMEMNPDIIDAINDNPFNTSVIDETADKYSAVDHFDDLNNEFLEADITYEDEDEQDLLPSQMNSLEMLLTPKSLWQDANGNIKLRRDRIDDKIRTVFEGVDETVYNTDDTAAMVSFDAIDANGYDVSIYVTYNSETGKVTVN